MHIIAKLTFAAAAERFPAQRAAIMRTYRNLKGARYNSPDDMRRQYPSLDNFKYKDGWWVLNLGGNHLRLIAFIRFAGNRMFVKHIVTHAEYDKLCDKYRRGLLK